MPDEVQFKSPTTGKVQAVPAEHWEEALSNGYTPTTHKVMYSPTGERGMVPNGQLKDYVKQGYQTTPKTQFEQNVTGQGISLQGAGTAAWNTIKGMIPPTPEGTSIGKFLVGSPSMDFSKGTLAQGGREAAAEYQRVRSAGAGPLAAGYSASISGAGPLVGVSDLEQQKLAQQGEGGQILGQSAVPAAATLAAPLLEGPLGKVAAQRRGMTPAASPRTGGINPEVAGTIGRTIGHATRIPGAGWVGEQIGRRFGTAAPPIQTTPFPGATSTDIRSMPPAPPATVSIAGTSVRTTPFSELPPVPKGEPTPFPRVMTKAELNAQARAAAAQAKAAAKVKPSPFGSTATSSSAVGPESFVPQESRNLTPFQPISEGTMTKTAPYTEVPGVTPPPPAPSPIITPEGMTAQPAVKGGKTSVLARGRQPIPLGVEPDMNNPAHAKIINDEIGQGLNEKKLDELRVRARMDDRFAKFLLNYWTRNRQ